MLTACPPPLIVSTSQGERSPGLGAKSLLHQLLSPHPFFAVFRLACLYPVECELLTSQHLPGDVASYQAVSSSYGVRMTA